MFRRPGSIQIKTRGELVTMRRAGLVVADALSATAAAVEPGVTTGHLDSIAARVLREAGARPSFLGYHGFPATICVSVNEQVVHGIPGGRHIRAGDLVSIDCGAIVDGWHGDAAVTVPAGDVAAEGVSLSRTTEESLWAGMAAAVAGGRLTDIGAAVESTVRAANRGYGILRDYVGHGIGDRMHMSPAVANVGPAGKGPRLRAGMALAVEPMVTLGSPDVSVLADDWTVVTDDLSWAAHWEHTVAITDDGPWVLTAHDGGAGRFAALGVATPAASLA